MKISIYLLPALVAAAPLLESRADASKVAGQPQSIAPKHSIASFSPKIVSDSFTPVVAQTHPPKAAIPTQAPAPSFMRTHQIRAASAETSTPDDDHKGRDEEENLDGLQNLAAKGPKGKKGGKGSPPKDQPQPQKPTQSIPKAGPPATQAPPPPPKSTAPAAAPTTPAPPKPSVQTQAPSKPTTAPQQHSAASVPARPTSAAAGDPRVSQAVHSVVQQGLPDVNSILAHFTFDGAMPTPLLSNTTRHHA